MTANDVNQVVEKVAEKIGVAVDVIQPVAETLLLETQRVGIAYFCFAVGTLTIAIIFGNVVMRGMRKAIKEDEEAMMALSLVLTVFCSIATCALCFRGFHRLAAPTTWVITHIVK